MLRFGAKVPGLGLDVRSVTMDFTYGSAFNVDSPDAYETLILDALQGDASLFTRADEVEEAWSIVDPDHRRRGPNRRRPTSRTTTPGRGARRRPTSCSPATAGAGAGSRSRSVTIEHDGSTRSTPPVLRWTARAHSIAEIESRAAHDLGGPGPDRPTRRRARRAASSARTSVMNLVVVARRPELAERCAATIQMLTGRHPSRTIVIQSADPDGPSWLDARVEAHCILPRDGRRPRPAPRRSTSICGGEAGRHLSAIATPLIIHDLPVTVWWPGEPPLARPRGDATSSPGRTGWSSTAPPGAATASAGCASMAEPAGHDAARHQRLRARPPVALARGDRLDLRRSGLPAVPALAAPDRGHLRHARRDRRARVDQPRQADLPRRLAGVATRASRVVKPLPRSPVRRGLRSSAPGRRGRGKPAMGRGLAATLSDGRAEVGVVVRPVVSHDAARHDAAGRAARRAARLRAAGRRDRRGRDRPRPRLAGRRRGARPASSGRRGGRRSTCSPKPSRSGRRDPVAVGALRSAALIIGAPGTPSDGAARSLGRLVSGPEIVVVARPGGRRRPLPPPRRATLCRGRVEHAVVADWATTGGSTPVGIYRRSSASRCSTTCRGATSIVWWGDDRFVPRDHPLSNVKPFDDIMLGIGRREEGTAGANNGRVRRSRPTNVHPFPTAEAIGAGAGRRLVRGRDGRRAARGRP